VVASANPVFKNTPVTYTSTPTNGGSTPAYQWQVNGVNVGTSANIPSGWGNYNYFGHLTGGVSNSEYFKGYINAGQIYNRALSAAEVLQNFNATKGRFGL
jgi:hypothetical protein